MVAMLQPCAVPGDATDEFNFWRQHKFSAKSNTQCIRFLI